MSKGKDKITEADEPRGKVTEIDDRYWLKKGDRVTFLENLLPEEPSVGIGIIGSFEIIGPEDDPRRLCMKYAERSGVAWLRDRRTGEYVEAAPVGCDPLDYDFVVYEHFGNAYAWFRVHAAEIHVEKREDIS